MTEDGPSPTTAADLVSGFFSAYDARDAAALEAVYAPEASHSEAALGRATSGRAAVLAGLADFFEAFPDGRWADRRELVTETAAAISYRFEGSLSMPMAGFPAAGQKVRLDGLMLLGSRPYRCCWLGSKAVKSFSP